MEVIITNMIIDMSAQKMSDCIEDHQSFTYNVESWETFVDSYKKNKPIGFTNGAIVEDLKYDNYHLSCVVVGYYKTITLAYIKDRVIVQ